MTRSFLIALAAMTPVAAAAQTGMPAAGDPGQLAPLLACRGESNEQARLRCYDAAVAGIATATQSGSLVVIDREEVRRSRRSLFGFSLPRLPFFRGDRSHEDEEQEEIQTTLVGARQVQSNRWNLELEGGALWQTTEWANTMIDPRAGQRVRIRRGVMGSYMVSINGQRGLRAMRIR